MALYGETPRQRTLAVPGQVRKRRRYPAFIETRPGSRALLLGATALIATAAIPALAAAQTAPATTATPPTHHHKSTARHHVAAKPVARTAHVVPAAAPVAAPAVATTVAANTAPPDQMESIMIRAQRRLLREQDSPSAVTEIGQTQIRMSGAAGNIVSLLRNAPSVYTYQQGIGNNEPVMSIRGTRGLEAANTLDGMPMQDLLQGGSGAFLQNVIAAPFTQDQISGVSVYPGVAYPDQSTFGTIGGTVAYHSLRPADKFGVDVYGGVGSFGTWREGFKVDSGQLDGALGRGVDAPKVMVQYDNMQTKGFIDYTPARYNSFEAALDKPYDEGQSMFQATVLYNTGSGLITPEPIPMPYLQQNGNFSNYSPDQEYFRQNNDYFTLMLKNDTYINDYINVGLSGFYRYSNSTTEEYANPALFAPNGGDTPFTVGGANPFNQTIAGFGEQGLYGYGNPAYQPGAVTYDGNAMYNNSPACPASVAAQWAAAGQTSPCGYNAYTQTLHTNTYGIQPRVSILVPEFWGIRNTIHIGGLVARETQLNTPIYYGITQPVPHDAINDVAGAPNQGGGLGGGQQRTIFSGYLQDKIDLLHNTLHITPGFTLQGTKTAYSTGYQVFGTPSAATLATPYCQANTCNYGPFGNHKWDREFLPFVNVTYDLDKIAPALKGVSFYGSAGTSALYAPTSDFSPSVIGSPPSASIVHMYEGGVKYNTSHWLFSADYYYQKVDRDFGFFQYQSGPLAGDALYTNSGQRLMRGQEVTLMWRPNSTWTFSGNFSHNSARYLKTYEAFVTVQEDQFGIAQRGSHVSGIPQWLAQFSVDYNKRNLLRRGDDLNVNLTGRYTGHQYTTYDLTGFQNIGPIPGTTGGYGTYDYYNTTAGATTMDPNGGIAPYVIFNLDVNYAMPVHELGPLKKVDFDLNVQNLFNTFYWQYKYRQISPASCGTFTSNPPGTTGFAGNAVSNYGCTPQFADGLPGMPSTIMFTVRASF